MPSEIGPLKVRLAGEGATRSNRQNGFRHHLPWNNYRSQSFVKRLHSDGQHDYVESSRLIWELANRILFVGTLT